MGTLEPYSLASVFTTVMLPLGIVHACGHRVKAHRATMVWLFVGAQIITGSFTLFLGRIMHEVVFGR